MLEPRSARPRRLLYVEDNLSDVFLVREALKECNINVDLATVADGRSALDYLRKLGRFAEAPTPDLVFLDLNLPGMTGDEVLLAIKSDPILKGLPVIVLTSAASQTICRPIYREYANTCVRKPLDWEEYTTVVNQICAYWFSLANLP